jgi:ElaA protein
MPIQISTFAQLSTIELYAILKLRQEVFINEQQSIYMDIDELDKDALHIQHFDKQQLTAYCRLRSVAQFSCFKIERVVTHPLHRGRGLGKLLMTKALKEISQLGTFGKVDLSAQLDVVDFYAAWGFIASGEAYDDGGIMHRDMWMELANQ